MQTKFKILIFLGIVLVAGLAAIFLFKKQQPRVSLPGQVKNPIQNSGFAKTEIGDIKYVGPGVSVPKTLSIYKNNGITLENLGKELAQRFNFSQSAFSKNVWISQDQKEALTVDSFNNRVEYSKDQAGSLGKEPKPNLNDSKKRAFDFLSSLGLTKTISPEPETVNYFKGVEYLPASREDAQIIEMSFKQTLGGYPLSTEIFSLSDIVVTTGTDNKVVKAIFPPRFVPALQSNEVATISFAEGVAILEAKKGSLVEVRSETEGKLITVTSLSNVSLSSAILEYRLSTKDNLFYPYFRFKGVAQMPENKEVSVIFLVPAVNIP